MNWLPIDVRWAEPGTAGEARFEERYLSFVVVGSTVDGADVLVLDTDIEACEPGTVQWFLWDAQFWQVAEVLGP